MVDTIGSGRGVAALFNARAKRVTPAVVRAMRRALPEALVLVSEDFDQARRHAARITAAKPTVVLAGGGDGSLVKLLNLLRETSNGAPLPTLGILKLGTGNAWARVSGADEYFTLTRRLPAMPAPLPAKRFALVEVEGQLCPFAGVGWDARLLNDYESNLDKRSEQLLGSRVATRLHKGLFGYLYSLFRLTVPGEVAGLRAHGQARVTIENLGEPALTLDAAYTPALVGPAPGSSAGVSRVLYDGPASVAGAASIPEWGFGFRAFPHARAVPGRINLRVYDRPALEATGKMLKLWAGRLHEEGMHDFFVTRAAMTFSRPMPFQIGGDGAGLRERLEYRIAEQTVDVVDWAEASALAGAR